MAGNKRAYVSLGFICVVWGTTYLAIRIGVAHYPPLMFAGVRQTLAGLMLAVVALFVSRQKDLSLQNIGRQALIGFLMLTLGNGCVTWSEKFIPSGVASLICSLMPVVTVLLNLAIFRGEKSNTLTLMGMALGFLGVALIFRNDVSQLSNPAYLGGMFVTLLGTSGWALGSIISKKNTVQINPFLNAAMQLFFGGLFMLAVSPFVDNWRTANIFDARGVAALLYLIIFGSVLAYGAYMYVLSQLPVSIATIYAYINPLVAVILGYLVLKETLNIFTVLSFAAIIAGVYLVNLGHRKQKKLAFIENSSNYQEAFPENAPVES